MVVSTTKRFDWFLAILLGTLVVLWFSQPEAARVASAEGESPLYDRNLPTSLLLYVMITAMLADSSRGMLRGLGFAVLIIYPFAYYLRPILMEGVKGEAAEVVVLVMMIVGFAYPFWLIAMALGLFLSWIGRRHS